MTVKGNLIRIEMFTCGINGQMCRNVWPYSVSNSNTTRTCDLVFLHLCGEKKSAILDTQHISQDVMMIDDI